jgi:hypothetical protein
MPKCGIIYFDRISFDEGFYYEKSQKANGIYSITRWGILQDHCAVYQKSSCTEVPFFEGIPLKSIQAYRILERVCKHYDITPTALLDDFPEIILEYSYTPIYDLWNGGKKYDFLHNKANIRFALETEDFTGTFPILFSIDEFELEVKDNVIISKKIIPYNHNILYHNYIQVLEKTILDENAEFEAITTHEKLNKLNIGQYAN